MSKRGISPRLYLEDMLQYCNYVLQFTSRTTAPAFMADVQNQFAVIRALEVLGEAARRLLELLPANDPRLSALPLQKAYANRNRLIHGYDTLDLETIWEISRTDIPKLKAALDTLLGSWPKDDS